MGIKSLWWFVHQGSARPIEGESVYSSVYLFISISPFLQNKRFATMIGFKPRWHTGKESVCQFRSHRRLIRTLGWEDPLEEEMTVHSSSLAWRIPWQRSLVGYSPWGCKESDTIEHTHTHTHTHTHAHTHLDLKQLWKLAKHSLWSGGLCIWPWILKSTRQLEGKWM